MRRCRWMSSEIRVASGSALSVDRKRNGQRTGGAHRPSQQPAGGTMESVAGRSTAQIIDFGAREAEGPPRSEARSEADLTEFAAIKWYSTTEASHEIRTYFY